MLWTIIGVIVAAIVILLVVASRKPDTFRLARSTVIAAPPEKIVPLIGDFHAWSGWSPWEKLDPALKRNFEGAALGKGAIYSWSGNNKVGEGRMEMLEVSPSRVLVDLQFFRPMKAHNKAEFDLTPTDGGTTVTWAMSGPLPFIGKVMHTVMSMDKMVGKDFEKGLASLKALAEA